MLAAPEPGWTAVSRTRAGVAIDVRSMTFTDGHTVTLVRFRYPLVAFVLHYGSQDPGSLAVNAGLRAGPAVTGAERMQLLAGFTGGFQLNNNVGGYEQEGHVLSTLRTGIASLVIDRNGIGHVGVWGDGLPRPGEAVYSVRQNLAPLVAGGAPSPTVDDIRAWGPTLGGGAAVARTALGEDAAGNLIFAGSMASVPRDLAAALVAAGARTGMELDINPEWVQLDYAPVPGGPPVAAIPGQHRPADQYLVGWTRDFVAVSAR